MTHKQKAVICARWLAACLRLGWPRSSLDALERIWWECEGWKYATEYRA